MSTYAEFKKALDFGFREKAVSILKAKWACLSKRDVQKIINVQNLDGAIQKCLIKRGAYDHYASETSILHKGKLWSGPIHRGQVDAYWHIIRQYSRQYSRTRPCEYVSIRIPNMYERGIEIRHKKIVRCVRMAESKPRENAAFRLNTKRAFLMACKIGDKKTVRHLLSNSVIAFGIRICEVSTSDLIELSRHINNEILKILLCYIENESMIYNMCHEFASAGKTKMVKTMLKRTNDHPGHAYGWAHFRRNKNMGMILWTDDRIRYKD